MAGKAWFARLAYPGAMAFFTLVKKAMPGAQLESSYPFPIPTSGTLDLDRALFSHSDLSERDFFRNGKAFSSHGISLREITKGEQLSVEKPVGEDTYIGH